MTRRDAAAVVLCAQSLALPGWGYLTVDMKGRAAVWGWLAMAGWVVAPWCGLVVHLAAGLATLCAWSAWHERNGWYFDAMRPADG